MAWFDVNYAYKKKITIDHTKVAGDETNFPVLISVTDNDLRNEANGGHVKHASGWDIIFTNSAEDTQLKHEIERYVNTNGLLVFWVRIPSLSSTVDTDIYIYYGKAAVGADPSTTDTWDANYKLVCHLDDPDTGTHVDDSTANTNDGTKKANTEPLRTTGKIGYGLSYTGVPSNDYINWGNIGSTFYGCSFWIKPAVTIDKNSPIGEILSVKTQYIDAVSGACTGLLTDETFVVMKVLGGDTREGITNNITSTSWHLIEVTWDGSEFDIYLDGSLGNMIRSGVTPQQLISSLKLGKYGIQITPIAEYDEFRVTINSGRSANWISTSYETQNTPAAFMSWGAEEDQSVATSSDIFIWDGSANVELQRDDTSPVQMYNGTEIIGLKLGATGDANASAIHVYDGTTIKAILKMP